MVWQITILEFFNFRFLRTDEVYRSTNSNESCTSVLNLDARILSLERRITIQESVYEKQPYIFAFLLMIPLLDYRNKQQTVTRKSPGLYQEMSISILEQCTGLICTAFSTAPYHKTSFSGDICSCLSAFLMTKLQSKFRLKRFKQMKQLR